MASSRAACSQQIPLCGACYYSPVPPLLHAHALANPPLSSPLQVRASRRVDAAGASGDAELDGHAEPPCRPRGRLVRPNNACPSPHVFYQMCYEAIHSIFSTFRLPIGHLDTPPYIRSFLVSYFVVRPACAGMCLMGMANALVRSPRRKCASCSATVPSAESLPSGVQGLASGCACRTCRSLLPCSAEVC